MRQIPAFFRLVILTTSLAALLTACGSSETGSSGSSAQARQRGDLPMGTADGIKPASCSTGKAAGGQVYRVEIPSRVDGESIVF